MSSISRCHKRVWWYISKFIIIIIIFIIHHCFNIWRCDNHHNQDIQLKAWEPLRLEQLLEQGNSVPEKCSTRRPLLWSLHTAWPASHDISHLVRSLWDKVKLTFFQGATSLWLTENSAAKQRGIIPNGMTLWQTQYPWWTQCPPLFLSPLSSVRPSRSCYEASRHGDIAKYRLYPENNHAFIFIFICSVRHLNISSWKMLYWLK